MKYVKRMTRAFLNSAVISMICLMIIEWIGSRAGVSIQPMTPEFVSHFPSITIAFAVDVILYGLIGVVFSGMTFIFDSRKLGLIPQNIIYFLGTTIVWVPLITLIWQLQKYPTALVGTIVGFLISEVIVTIVGMKSARKDVASINRILAENNK